MVSAQTRCQAPGCQAPDRHRHRGARHPTGTRSTVDIAGSIARRACRHEQAARVSGHDATQHALAVARGEAPADLVLRGATVADVFTGTTRVADVAIVDGRIVGVGEYRLAEETIDVAGLTLVPAFIEGHMHVESTLLAPAELARVVGRDGTGTVIADPHEIANVSGPDGIRWMRDALAGAPVDVRLQVSPCVPATPNATTGGAITADDVRELLGEPGTLGIAELMDFPGAVAGNDGLLDKLAARGERPVDGHAPGLSGAALQAYALLGPSSDHECTTAAEAREKLAAGLYLMVRAGSTADNLDALMGVVLEQQGRRCLFVNDDVTAGDLLRRGHLTEHLRRAVAAGLDPIAALRMVTLNAAELYGLHDRGAIAPGRRADLVAVEDLQRFAVRHVWLGGQPIETWRPAAPVAIGSPVNLPSEIDVAAARARATQGPAIGYIDGQLLTSREDGPGDGDALLLTIDRHSGRSWASARVRGFGIARGAIATTVAHDHHNLMVIGADDDDIAAAVELARGTRGGLWVVQDGRAVADLALDLGGLMSDQPADAVAAAYAHLTTAAHDLGAIPRDPLMALSFLGLEVIPDLKLTDLGLVDVLAGRLLEPHA
jgi:adenine deaminase